MSFYSIIAIMTTIVASIEVVAVITTAIQVRLAVRDAEAAAAQFRIHQAPTTANAAAQAWFAVLVVAQDSYQKQYASTERSFYMAAAEKQRLDW